MFSAELKYVSFHPVAMKVLDIINETMELQMICHQSFKISYVLYTSENMYVKIPWLLRKNRRLFNTFKLVV